MTQTINKWRITTLGEVANLQKGMTITAKSARPGNVPVIAGGKKPAYFHSEANRPSRTITVSASGAYAGHVAFHRVPIWASDCVTAVPTDPQICTPEFLYYFMLSKQNEIYGLQRGSGMPHVYAKDLALLEIGVPPLDEQSRIIETLDDHLSRLDKALTESHYAASATLRFSASLLHSMFTGDLMQRELGVEELNLTALAEVAEVQSGGTPKGLDRLSSETATGDHTVPFYKVGDMNLDARYMKASRSYLTHKDIDALRLKVIPSGSVVFPKAGGAIATDKKRLVQVPGPIDLNCMAVIPGKAILPTYLAWWFESFKLSDLSNGSILPQIGKTAVMQVRLPIPSLSDQEKIVQYLEENISMVRSEARTIDGVAASISTLRRSVLNDAFSGKLVDRY